MAKDASELVKECEKHIGWIKKPAWYSFTSNFEYFKEFLKYKLDMEKTEIAKFVEICDHRIERAKTLLGDVATVLGFGVAGATIMVTFSGVLSNSKENVSLFLTGLFVFLIVGIIFGFLLLIHYRTHVHAWTAFKEAVILSKEYTKEK
jgi:hypothetical protein